MVFKHIDSNCSNKLYVCVILPQCQSSEEEKGLAEIDLPIVMKTMFIVQLQIVPD